MKKFSRYFILLTLSLFLFSCTDWFEGGHPTDAAKPEILLQPQNVQTDTKTSVLLTVEAVSPDGGNLSYLWYEKAGEDEIALNDETSESISITKTESDIYEFFCEITNINESKSVTRNTRAKTKSRVARVTVTDPLASGEPDNPDEPGTPQNPQNPQQPENPDTPTEPDVPDTPTEPDTPATANYTVEYYFENLEDDEYTRDENKSVTINGQTGTYTNVFANQIDHYLLQPFNQEIIKADGSTKIKVYYKRARYTLTLNLEGGKGDTSFTGKYGESVAVTAPTKDKYTFSGWSPELPAVLTENTNHTATWQEINILFNITIAPDNDISLGYMKNGNEITLTGTAGLDSYEWYVDSTKKAGQETNTLSLNGAELTEGLHNVLLVAKSGSLIKSAAVTIKVQNEYTVTYDANGGTFVPGAETTATYTSNTGLALAGADILQERTGYEFTGWYYDAQCNTPCGDQIPAGDAGSKTVYAGWQGIRYTIRFDANGGTGTMETQSAIYGKSFTLSAATFTKQGYHFADWNTKPDGTGTAYLDKDRVMNLTCIDGAEVVLYAMWEADFSWYMQPRVLPEGTDGTAGTGWKYVEFGLWPKTIKEDDITVNEEISCIMGSNIYYKGSDEAWYAKCLPIISAEDANYSNGKSVKTTNPIYIYFKVEPIKWRVLTTNYLGTGKVLLFAEEGITSNVPYYADVNNRIINGNTVYPNNYKYSTIRAFLNGQYEAGDTQTRFYEGIGFLQTAFSEETQILIATTVVDNSAQSSNPSNNAIRWNNGVNDYACENTADKVFLLSVQEITSRENGFAVYISYGEGNTRIRFPTDYALANNACAIKTKRYAGWCWLRSPDYNDAIKVREIDETGEVDYSSNSLDKINLKTAIIVPALCIDADLIK